MDNAASWNISALVNLFYQGTRAEAQNNVTGLVSVTNAMNTVANQLVMYLWTFYPETFVTMTSNIRGYFQNSALLYGYQFAYLS